MINQGRVGIIKGDVFDDGSSFYVDYSDKNNWEVMQYTGLKDKNGKEIYEGDIIKSGNGALGVVKWRYFGFEQDMINTLGWWVIQEDGEVIGNIYENPELLE